MKKSLQDQRQAPSKLPEWNGYLSDLSSMQITKEELARRVAARQSSNLALARAEMLQKSREKSNARPFSPALSARLRASTSKTVDDALADSAAALALARKVKDDGVPDPAPHYQEPNAHMFSQYYPPQRSQDYAAGYSLTEEESRRNLPSDPSTIDEDSSNGGDFLALAHPNSQPPQDPLSVQLPLTEQGWQNLNNTIQLVVKTCEALWIQLEDERMNRERLHHQLQEQRNVITTLTSELLQIQDHQETILRELHAAKSTGILSAPPPIGQSGAGAVPATDYFQPTSRYQPPAYTSPETAQRLRSAGFKRTGRMSPRPLAYSDSSLNTPEMPPRMQLNLRMSGSPALMRREETQHLRYQGKSKSATQLDLGQDNPNYEKELATNVALLQMTKNYPISDQ